MENLNDIKEKLARNILIRNMAMHVGTVMGLFWVLRFALFVLGLHQPLGMMVFLLTTLGVPLLAGVYMFRFRNRALGGAISFLDALKFGMLMCFYASLLVAVAHFIYFRFLDHGFVVNVYSQTIQLLESAPEGDASTAGLSSSLQEALDLWAEMSPISITLQLLSNNLIWSVLMIVPLAAIVRRKHPVINE